MAYAMAYELYSYKTRLLANQSSHLKKLFYNVLLNLFIYTYNNFTLQVNQGLCRNLDS